MGKFQIFPDGRAAGSAPVSGSDFVTKDYLASESVAVNSASAWVAKRSASLESSASIWMSGTGQKSARLVVAGYASGSDASGMASMTIGGSTTSPSYANTASGRYSFAQGIGAKALADGTYAQGRIVEASGQYSHAEGSNSRAYGSSSHAEGYNTVASGNYSHAEGYGTLASSAGAHAEGNITTASSQYSHAEGWRTTALGSSSHAEGYYTTASNPYEHAQGRYNVTSSNQIFSVGVGSGTSVRRNAISIITGSGVTPSASIYLYGVGTYNGTNPILGTNDIATVISNLTGSIASASYSSTDKKIYFFNAGGTASAEIDATDFIKDGMVDSVEVSGSYLVLTFNTDAGKEPVSMSLTRIFNPDNFYTKTDVDTLLSTMSVGDVNVIEAVEFNGTASTISNKTASISVELPAAPNQDAENWVTENSASLVTESIWIRGTGSGSAVLSGSRVLAEGVGSIAHGSQITASGQYAHAEGYRTKALGDYSHAEGVLSTASGIYSHAEGNYTRAIGNTSHAEGYGTEASGTYARAYGYETSASGTGAHAEGRGTKAAGNYSHAEGYITTASGDYSHAEGVETVVLSSGSHAEGYRTKVSGAFSHAEGSNTTASGSYTHAEGSNTVASGQYSHAEGGSARASGMYSHAEGNGRSVGDYSHAEGRETIASGNYSHAEGYSTHADGDYSHAEGSYTKAVGLYSHVEGIGTEASGMYSHAEGRYVSTSNDYEHAQGTYNAAASSQIFSVGVGNTNTRRKNAISIITGSNPSASIYIYGIGTYDGTNPQPGVNDLATVISGLTGSQGGITTETDPVYLADSASLKNAATWVGANSGALAATASWDTAASQSHTHSNGSLLNSLTNAKTGSWDSANTWVTANSSSALAVSPASVTASINAAIGGITASHHTHSNKAVLDGITAAKTASWDSAATSATALNSISASLIASGTLAKNVTAITASLVASASVAKTASSSAAALSAKSASWDAKVGLPTVTAADNGKILRVVNGAWALVDPVTVYSGQGAPDSALGQDGDIYLQS